MGRLAKAAAWVGGTFVALTGLGWIAGQLDPTLRPPDPAEIYLPNPPPTIPPARVVHAAQPRMTARQREQEQHNDQLDLTRRTRSPGVSSWEGMVGAFGAARTAATECPRLVYLEVEVNALAYAWEISVDRLPTATVYLAARSSSAEQARRDRRQFCAQAWRAYGPNGSTAHLIDRR